MGLDLLSYSLGLLTAAPVLILAGLVAHLTDKPNREPADTAGRIELLTIDDSPLPPDLPEHPGTRDHSGAYTWTRRPLERDGV
jgi:hypothetical protein